MSGCTAQCNQGRNCQCGQNKRAEKTAPAGGFWFAPGTIESQPAAEPWGLAEWVLAGVAVSSVGGIVAGLIVGWLKGGF